MTTVLRPPHGGRPSAPDAGARILPFSPRHIALIPIAFVFVVPLLQMFLAALSPAAELIQYPPPFIPSHLTLERLPAAVRTSPTSCAGSATRPSCRSIAIVSNLVLCSLAGYGFARLRFRGRNFGFFGILATIMIPTQVLMIPTFVMFASVGLTNTLGAAIVPWLASAFGIFLMRQFFLSLPAELEEAGLIDGCNRLQVFWRIVLPLAKPALATLAIFTLLGAWNDLVWPIVAINNPAGVHAPARDRELPGRPAHRLGAAHGGQRGRDAAADPLLRRGTEAVRRHHDLLRAQGVARSATAWRAGARRRTPCGAHLSRAHADLAPTYRRESDHSCLEPPSSPERSSGLGRASAERLAADGVRVVTLDVADGADVVADIADPAAVAAVADRVGPVDILINSAGIVGPNKPFQEIQDDEWARTFAVNVHGTFHLCRAFVPGMIERGWGRVSTSPASPARRATRTWRPTRRRRPR